MLARCTSKTHANYGNYGGRGISICSRWSLSYEAFYCDMGPRPSPKHSIDRIDNDGNYEPGNCRWATSGIQSRNRRTTKLTEQMVRHIRAECASGRSHSAVARELGIRRESVSQIVRRERWADVA